MIGITIALGQTPVPLHAVRTGSWWQRMRYELVALAYRDLEDTTARSEAGSSWG